MRSTASALLVGVASFAWASLTIEPPEFWKAVAPYAGLAVAGGFIAGSRWALASVPAAFLGVPMLWRLVAGDSEGGRPSEFSGGETLLVAAMVCVPTAALAGVGVLLERWVVRRLPPRASD